MKRIVTIGFAAAMLLLMAGMASPASARAALRLAETDFDTYFDQQQPSRFGKDSLACVRNWSLYDQYFSQGNFRDAMEGWRYMFLHCPAASQRVYQHGVTLMQFMFNNETDPIRREAYIDTLMMIFDQRIQYFGHERTGRKGFVLGRKAVTLFPYRPDAIQQHYDISERSIELEGMASQADVLFLNFRSAAVLVEAGLMDADKVVEKYDRAMDIIQYHLTNNPADETYANARNNIEAIFEPFASCDNLVRIFQPRFEASPTDTDLLLKITEMLEKVGCTESPLFYAATESLHRLRPTAQSAFLMGRMESSRENFTRAIEYFEEAIKLYEADGTGNFIEERFRTYLLMADISFRNLRRYPQARNYALAANRIKVNDGRPFIIIGEMYALSANDCGDDEFTKKTAYWAAVDKFIQARDADPDQAIKDLASSRIATYSQYFPTIELIFFYGYEEGQTYRVGCWINETTRIRKR